jgi:hypothetical protein
MTANLKYLFTLLSAFCALNSYAQNIENVDFVVRENNIIVTYDVAGCGPKQLYDIKLIAFCDGKEIHPQSISGDLKKISCGKQKRIEWNVLNDNIELKGSLQVVVAISKTYSTKITNGPSNAFYSMLLPGLGDHFINKNNKRWYYISLAYVGLGYYAFKSKSESNDYYGQYHQATTQKEMDETYEAANSKYQTFQILLGLTAAVWVSDVVYVAVKGFKNRRDQLNSLSFKEPKTRFYVIGTSNSFKVGLIKSF